MIIAFLLVKTFLDRVVPLLADCSIDDLGHTPFLFKISRGLWERYFAGYLSRRQRKAR